MPTFVGVPQFVPDPLSYIGNRHVQARVKDLAPLSKWKVGAGNCRDFPLRIYDSAYPDHIQQVVLAKSDDINAFAFEWPANIAAPPLLATWSVHYLPWKADHAYAMKLDNTHSGFVTAPLDGCTIIINGSRSAPVVVHANRGGVPRLDESPEANWRRIYERENPAFFATLAECLEDPAASFVTDNDARTPDRSELEALTFAGDKPTTLFGPPQYTRENKMKATVFGACHEGAWTFYGCRPSGRNYETIQIWP